MIEKNVDTQHNLTIHRASGKITSQELLSSINSFYDGSPTLYTLWDFSKAALSSISNESIRQMFSLVQNRGTNRQNGKTAIVATKDLEYGMSRMFQIMSTDNEFPFTIKVFRSYDEAIQWILRKE
jgi:hypothetical protein